MKIPKILSKWIYPSAQSKYRAPDDDVSNKQKPRAFRALKNLLHLASIEKGDNHQGSTTFQGRIKTNIDTTKINALLQNLGFEKYNGVNAAKFFDEETNYSNISKSMTLLNGSLINFGVPDDYRGKRKLKSSLAHKNLVRTHLDETLNKPLPKKDRDLLNKIISFQIFSFANADLLIGKLKYQQERYQSYVKAAVNNLNILPLVMMKELAGISPKDAFSNENAFKKLIAKASPEIAEYLNNN